MSTNKYMQLAIEEALYGINHNQGGPFGCVIVKDGKVIAKAHNEVLRKKDATEHAEMRAVKIASKKLRRLDLSDCELYTTGKPCPMCHSAIMWSKIKKVYFGCDYDDAKVIGFNEESGNSYGYTEERIDSEECKRLYEEYTSKKHLSY